MREEISKALARAYEDRSRLSHAYAARRLDEGMHEEVVRALSRELVVDDRTLLGSDDVCITLFVRPREAPEVWIWSVQLSLLGNYAVVSRIGDTQGPWPITEPRGDPNEARLLATLRGAGMELVPYAELREATDLRPPSSDAVENYTVYNALFTGMAPSPGEPRSGTRLLARSSPYILIWLLAFLMSMGQTIVVSQVGIAVTVCSIITGMMLQSCWSPLLAIDADSDEGLSLSPFYGPKVLVPWASVVGVEVHPLRGKRAFISIYTGDGSHTLLTFLEPGSALKNVVFEKLSRFPMSDKMEPRVFKAAPGPTILVFAMHLLSWTLLYGPRSILYALPMPLVIVLYVASVNAHSCASLLRRRERRRVSLGAPPYR